MPVLTEIERSGLENLHTAKEVDGQLFICDISLYINLFNQHLKKSEGNIELAKKYTHLAIKNDSTPLVQENVSALKDKNGQFIIDDLKLRASIQQTPTRHVYLETIDQTTGKRVMTSPEYTYLGTSITSALTEWRRGNDLAAVTLAEELSLNLSANKKNPEDNQKVEYTLGWGSPMAEKWEDPIIRKYNGKYGYFYVGHLTEEAGRRRLEIYSYKTDFGTTTYLNLMANTKGKFHRAPCDINPDKVYKNPSPLLDRLMRTVAVIDRSLSEENVISRLYQAKKEVEGSDRIFGILEDTMNFIQNPALRDRIEKEVSTPIADWLVNQILKGIPQNIIQDQIRDKYIFYLKNVVKNIKQEQIELFIWPILINENRDIREELKRRIEPKGEFCGSWGSSESYIFKDPLEDLKNYIELSGTQLSGGGFTKETKLCDKCKLNKASKGPCGYFCESCE